MKYYANFNVNNGTRLASPLEDTDKRRLAKTVRECARGELFAGNTGSWGIIDETGAKIASGIVRF